jgi:hypothetical protein
VIEFAILLNCMPEGLSDIKNAVQLVLGEDAGAQNVLPLQPMGRQSAHLVLIHDHRLDVQLLHHANMHFYQK